MIDSASPNDVWQIKQTGDGFSVSCIAKIACGSDEQDFGSILDCLLRIGLCVRSVEFDLPEDRVLLLSLPFCERGETSQRVSSSDSNLNWRHGQNCPSCTALLCHRQPRVSGVQEAG